MYDVYVKDLIDRCDCKLIVGDINLKIENVFVNTKNTILNGTFFGIKGNKCDGSSYYKEAFFNGCNVCVLSYFNDDINKYKDKCILISDNVLLAMQKLAKYKRSLFKKEVIGVTGSIGKTTTKEIIANILSKKYNVLKTNGNLNGQIGVCLTILGLTNEDIMVIEMGISKEGEMDVITDIVRPTIAVITNVSHSHIGNFNSIYEILNEKVKITKYANFVIINNDNKYLNDYFNNNVIKYSIKDNLTVKNIKEGIVTRFDIDDLLNLQINGTKSYIYNYLAAYKVCKLLDISNDLIKDGINNFKNVNHRLQVIEKDNSVIIDDCYNASYESVKAAIKYLDKYYKEKIIVIADILELGKQSRKTHKMIGKLIKHSNIKYVISIGNYSKAIYKLNKYKKVAKHFKCEKDSRRYLLNLINNKVVLIKGSNGMHLINLVNYLICNI